MFLAISKAIAVQQIGLLSLGQPFQAIVQLPARFLFLYNALRLHGVGVCNSFDAPQRILEEQESRRELYSGLQRLTDREQTYLLYRYGFTDGEEHPLIGTAIYFHLTKGRAKKTEEQAMDNLWLELPWWFD